VNKKKFKNVLVVLGGTSGERAVSLDSGKACIKALRKKKYVVSTFDPKFKNLNLINKNKTDVIFNALHGKDGEDGIAQSYFEYLKIPYTHSGVLSSYNAMNKIVSKEIFIKNNIKTPKFFTIKKKNLKLKILKKS
jgi:D-alanine--D-alanine ligase